MSEDRKNEIRSDTLLTTTRRRLLALGASAGALAWAGPK